MIDYGFGIAFDTIDRCIEDARWWRNKPEVYSKCRQFGLIDEKSHERWYESVSADRSNEMFSVVLGSFAVGVAGLTGISYVHGTAEISLYCDNDQIKFAADNGNRVNGRIAPAIIKTLSCYAFLDLRLNRIFGDTFANNTVEIANLTECGFTIDGTLRQSYYKKGQHIDSIIQSMLKSEFNERYKEWSGIQ